MVAVRDRYGRVEPCPDDVPAGLLISDRHTIRCHTAPDIGLLIRIAVSMSFPNGKSKPACPMSYVFSGR
jgi:hypothetical protein